MVRNLSSRVRLSLLEKSMPSQMRERSGTANTASLRPVTRIETTWKEWPMMYSPIGKIKEELVSLGRLRPGSLAKQYNVCTKAQCRCKGTPPKRHGPYYQLSFTQGGKSTTRFVRREHLTRIKEELRNYKRLQKLLDKWIGLEMQLSEIRMAPTAR